MLVSVSVGQIGKSDQSATSSTNNLVIIFPSTNNVFFTQLIFFVMCGPSSSSRFRLLFDNALKDYEQQMGTKLNDHPLARHFETCNSVESITAIFQEQSRAFREFRGDGPDGKLMKPLHSAVHILHTLSASTVLGEGIGLARQQWFFWTLPVLMCVRQPFPPARAIFAGFAILLGVRTISLSVSFVRMLTIPHIRRLRTLAQASMHSSTYSSASETSFNDLIYIPRSLLHRQ
jgi:hypothetical protein